MRSNENKISESPPRAKLIRSGRVQIYKRDFLTGWRFASSLG